ncbi:hypothetical protein HPB47_024991, partial [Ixodes persulcatus]
LKLERIHRQGLRTALGVPRGTSNLKVYEEARALPLPLMASQHLLLQMLRLEETTAGLSLLRRITRRPLSRFGISLRTLPEMKQQIVSLLERMISLRHSSVRQTTAASKSKFTYIFHHWVQRKNQGINLVS